MLNELKKISLTVIEAETKGFDGIKIYCPSILTGGSDEN